jgi:hypothetical protein
MNSTVPSLASLQPDPKLKSSDSFSYHAFLRVTWRKNTIFFLISAQKEKKVVK